MQPAARAEPAVQSPARVEPAVQPAVRAESSPAANLTPTELVEPHAAARQDQAPASGVIERWRVILDKVRKTNLGVASVLEHAVPIELSAETVTLGFEAGSFYEAQAKHENALDLLTRIVRDHFQCATAVSFSLRGDAGPQAKTVYDIDEAERIARMEKERSEIEHHPLVQAAVRELGARIAEIKLAKG